MTLGLNVVGLKSSALVIVFVAGRTFLFRAVGRDRVGGDEGNFYYFSNGNVYVHVRRVPLSIVHRQHRREGGAFVGRVKG